MDHAVLVICRGHVYDVCLACCTQHLMPSLLWQHAQSPCVVPSQARQQPVVTGGKTTGFKLQAPLRHAGTAVRRKQFQAQLQRQQHTCNPLRVLWDNSIPRGGCQEGLVVRPVLRTSHFFSNSYAVTKSSLCSDAIASVLHEVANLTQADETCESRADQLEVARHPLFEEFGNAMVDVERCQDTNQIRTAKAAPRSCRHQRLLCTKIGPSPSTWNPTRHRRLVPQLSRADRQFIQQPFLRPALQMK